MSHAPCVVSPADRATVDRWSAALDDRLFAIPSALFLLAPFAAVLAAVFCG